MRIALIVHSYYKECREPSKKQKAFGIYVRKEWLRIYRFSYKKSEIVKCEKGDKARARQRKAGNNK
jgi:hypothetical protein